MRALAPATLIAALLAAPLLAVPGLARAQSSTVPSGDMMRMIQVSARNQLGVFEYCQQQGAVGADVVDLQKKLIGMLPATDATGLDEAEELGKSGTVEFNGQKVALADAAKQQNSTPIEMCKKMAGLVQAQAAQLPH